MIDVLLRFIGTPWISGPIFALIAVFAFLALMLVTRGYRALRRLQRIVERLRKIPPDEQAIEAIGLVLADERALHEQWEEFKEGLVEIDGVRYNSISTDALIKDEAYLHSITWWRFHFPLVHQVANIATGLGLLGTFVGIAVGLYKLHSGLGGEAEAIDTSLVKAVISNLSTAFTTSIVGVVVGLGSNLSGSSYETGILAELDRLREAIDRRITRITAESLLAQLAKLPGTGQQAVDALKDSCDLGRNQIRVLNDIKANMSTAEKSSAERTQHLEDRLAVLLEDVAREVEESRAQLQTISNDLADKLGERFHDSLSSTLGPQLEAITQAVKEQVAQAESSASQEAKRFVDEMVGRLSGELGQSFATLGGNLSSATSDFSAASRDLKAIVDGTREVLQQQREAIEAGGAAVEKTVQQARVLSEELVAVQKIGSDMGVLVRSLGRHYDATAALQSRHAELQSAAGAQIGEVSKTLAEATRSFKSTSDALAGLLPRFEGSLQRSTARLGDAFGGFQGEVKNLSAGVANTLDATRSIGESLRAVGRELNARLEAETALLAGYRTAASSFETSFRAGVPVLKNLTQITDRLEQQQKTIGALAASLASASKTLADTQGALSRGLESVEGVARRASEDVERAVTGVAGWSEGATQAVQHFGDGLAEAVQKSLAEYDRSLAIAVNGLSQSMRALEDLAEELASAGEARARKR